MTMLITILITILITMLITILMTKAMNLRSALILIAGFAASLLTAHAHAHAHPIEVVDDRGVKVRFDSSPQRIVSILPSLTESVCALGQCARVVGVDRYSNYPESVTKLPKVGGGIDPNIEAIVALKPDLVLMGTSTRATERLESLGIKVMAIEPKTHDDVRRTLIKLGQVLEVPDALRVWNAIDRAIFAAAQSVPESAKKIRVYFEVSNGAYAAGEASFIGETLKRLGVSNIAPASLGPFPNLNPEFVVRANPDLMMMAESSFVALENRPGWQTIRAVKEKRVCTFTLVQTDALLRAGPRMVEAATIMAECLRNKAP
jgi:iron complex transport system substrate-binding protein